MGLRPSRLWSRAKARLLLTDRDLDPGSNHTALGGFSWTGTTEIGVEPAARSDRPRVLVALSSSAFPGMLPIYRRIVAALADLPIDATVTTGGVDFGGRLIGAPNVEIRGYVPHHELLPAVDLVIGHGGHSTTLKVLAHSVPLLVLPINPTADQHLIGKALQGAGLGRCLPRSATPAAIREAATAILDDHRLHERAASTGRRLRSLPPGAEVAADQVLEVMNRGS
ncbi:glycosyltransferase [Arthrobacter sp. JSM 101049]|uniref:glycosyltransferase n=1 Tax=Arthrobacter sp. JSM 101049 TaxID=929097 RepID=UPI003566A319